MDRFQQRALSIASDSGHAWVDQLHLLAALPDFPHSSAAAALKACGVAKADVVALLTELSRDVGEPHAGDSKPSPRFEATVRRAREMAATRRRAVRSVDYLAACLIAPGGTTDALLASRHDARFCLISHLQTYGFERSRFPDGPDPRRQLGMKVSIRTKDLSRVIRDLRAALPPGSPIAFNHDGGGRAWVIGPKGVDIRTYLDPDLELLDDTTERRSE